MQTIETAKCNTHISSFISKANNYQDVYVISPLPLSIAYSSPYESIKYLTDSVLSYRFYKILLTRRKIPELEFTKLRAEDVGVKSLCHNVEDFYLYFEKKYLIEKDFANEDEFIVDYMIFSCKYGVTPEILENQKDDFLKALSKISYKKRTKYEPWKVVFFSKKIFFLYHLERLHDNLRIALLKLGEMKTFILPVLVGNKCDYLKHMKNASQKRLIIYDNSDNYLPSAKDNIGESQNLKKRKEYEEILKMDGYDKYVSLMLKLLNNENKHLLSYTKDYNVEIVSNRALLECDAVNMVFYT